MTQQAPSLAEWKKLYDLMIELKTLSPWQWLEEDDIFALQNPETDQLGFLSIMGSMGEHYSVSVYLGEEGLRKFCDFQQNDTNEFSFQRLLEMPQLQASFENRDYLFPEDR
ncbi:hypothetical protein JW998_13120, partial [candidate division KSB1 bacterium]|nr:hypothetical protein [candidate division KSB1 bacterium]